MGKLLEWEDNGQGEWTADFNGTGYEVIFDDTKESLKYSVVKRRCACQTAEQMQKDIERHHQRRNEEVNPGWLVFKHGTQEMWLSSLYMGSCATLFEAQDVCVADAHKGY